MSRSLCDQVAHSVGVSSVPEYFERELDPNLDCILIIATDGLWEFMSDQEAIDTAVQAGEPSAAVNVRRILIMIMILPVKILMLIISCFSKW